MPSPTSFYADFAKLTELKGSAHAQNPQALREAARQFESLFTQMMLKSMRQANESMPSGTSMVDNDQSKMYLEMFDNQLALQLSKGRGLGLADMLTKQLAQMGAAQGVAEPTAPPTTTKKPNVDGIALGAHVSADRQLPLTKREAKAPLALAPWKSVALPIRLPARPKNEPIADQAPAVSNIKADASMRPISGNDSSNSFSVAPTNQVNPLLNTAPPWMQSSTASVSNAFGASGEADEEFRVHSVLSDSDAKILADRLANPSATTDSLAKKPGAAATSEVAKKPEPLARTAADFVKQLWPHAQKAARELGVDAKTLIAHAALETGWGKFVPCNPDGSCSFNLFGIKATGRWTGGSTAVNTLEYEGGIAVRKRESFRAYDSPADSFRDYAALIKNSPRYSAAVGAGTDTAAFATALQQGGYATDPSYADKLTSVASRLDSMPWLMSQQEQVQPPLKVASTQPLPTGRSASSGDEI
jgi:flagellar rod assembly protein/muramidase FlgJ